MIVSIEGILIEAAPLRAVVDVQGIGYELHIPLPTAGALPPIGQKVRLHTVAVYREDTQALYGFHELPLRDFFRLLVEKVSGIGPKMALTILSRMSLKTLQLAISNSDIAMLSQCPGIGKKTAERLIVELRDKVFAKEPSVLTLEGMGPNSALKPSQQTDAIAALISLGFKLPEAEKSVLQALKQLGSEASTQELVVTALSWRAG